MKPCVVGVHDIKLSQKLCRSDGINSGVSANGILIMDYGRNEAS